MEKPSVEVMLCHKCDTSFRSSRPEVFCKKGVLRIFTRFTGKHLKLQPSGLYFVKKEALAQVFSCEFCQISQSTFLHRTPGGCFCCFQVSSVNMNKYTLWAFAISPRMVETQIRVKCDRRIKITPPKKMLIYSS